MPVRRTKAQPRHSFPRLVERIADELIGSATGDDPNAPLIYETEQTYGGYLHVTIIWKEWANVPMEERGAVIADAYERAGKRAVYAKVTRILGLTPEEKEKLGIDPEAAA